MVDRRNVHLAPLRGGKRKRQDTVVDLVIMSGQFLLITLAVWQVQEIQDIVPKLACGLQAVLAYRYLDGLRTR